MKPFLATLIIVAASSVALQGQEKGHQVAQIEDQALTQLETELVPLAEAMPADKYQFAPTGGQFKNVRTFAQEMTHIATVLYEASSGLLGEKMPVAAGTHENGSDALNNKAAIVKYLKDAFAYSHRALRSLTDENLSQTVEQPWKTTRLGLAEALVWHSYDHYGQSVVYLRMNGIVPPASR